MAYALTHGIAAPDRNTQSDTVKWTIGLSVLFHIAVGWLVINQLIGMPLEAEPEPLVIQIEPIAKVAPPPPPPVKTDPQEVKDVPRPPPVHQPPIVAEAPPMEPSPFPPQPIPAEPGPVGPPALETVPAAAPSPTHRVGVKYPPRALDREIEGTATVQIIVAAGGAVSDVQVVNETPTGYRFGEAAADAVWQWQFATTQPGTYRVTVRFNLE